MARTSELIELTRVRVLLFLREPEILFWVFAFPVVLAGILGFAFRRGAPQPSRIGIVAGVASARIDAALDGAEGLEVRRPDLASAERDLRRGRVELLVYAEEPPRLRFDAARPEAELARLRVERALERAGALPDPAPAKATSSPAVLDKVDERGSRYLDFLFPGLLGMNLMGTGMWSLGFAIGDMRQRKLLRRLLVTPMRRSSFLASLLSARFVFLVLEVVALVLVGVFALDVPFRGSVLGFALVCALAGLTFSALGVLVASRAKTIQGVSGMLNLAMVPMWLGSGVFFSYERFPETMHPLLKLLPLTALNDALRGLMLDGVGLGALLPELAIQLGWLVLCSWLGLKIFRWE
jgi:ABC-type polysaccharide/polyol phosphate export permease